MGWIEEGLIERSITRDTNWGVPVPIEGVENKVLYVWFDAPIGYISSTIEWSPDRWQDYWFDKETKLVHFIGKDNIPFHAIIWPSLLMGQDKEYVLPWDIPANEYLTLEGQKISTSRDWAIWVEDFVKDFDGELLRFVLAANAPETKDADFSWKDFQNLVNNSLANVLGNLANRVFSFSKKNFDGILNVPEHYKPIPDNMIEIIEEVYSSYSEFKVRRAVKLIIDLAREGNKYFDDEKPWVVVKEDLRKTEITIFNCVELLRVISIIMYPIIPQSMMKLRKMMGLVSEGKVLWSEINNTPKQYNIGDFEPLFKKIDDKEIEEQINRLYEKSKEE
jgi:methionyl-tRNA synthetase